VARATPLQVDIDIAEPMHEKHEIGAECAIHQQFAAPMTIWPLLPQQILLRAGNGLRNFRIDR
jgi:hypothetical protein